MPQTADVIIAAPAWCRRRRRTRPGRQPGRVLVGLGSSPRGAGEGCRQLGTARRHARARPARRPRYRPRPLPSSASPPSATASSAPGPGQPASTALTDFTRATFTTPSGFERSSSYSPAVPLESSYTSSFLVPTNAPTGRTVIGVYVYALLAGRDGHEVHRRPRPHPRLQRQAQGDGDLSGQHVRCRQPRREPQLQGGRDPAAELHLPGLLLLRHPPRHGADLPVRRPGA